MLYLSILGALILKLENEKQLYDENLKTYIERAKSIRDKYKIGLELDSFLSKISQIKNREEIIVKYEELKKKEIGDGKCYEDIFCLDLDDSNDNRIAYGLKISKNLKYQSPSAAKQKRFQINEAIKGLGEKVIVSSIQYFEEFFSVILRGLILSKPEAYFYNKNIPYKELVVSDFEKIKNDMINEEVRSKMYAITDTIGEINKIHKLHLENYKDLWDKYIEIDMHRNIIIHNRGVVNKEYNSVVAEKYKKNEDSYIAIKKELVHSDIDAIIKFAFLFSYLCWDDEEEFDELESVAFDFLKKQEWELARFAYELLQKIPELDYSNKINFKINYLNAEKHIKGLDATKEEIEKLDITGMTERFKIAKLLLLENNQEVLNTLDSAYPNEFNTYNIIEWPIFIEFRKTEEFKTFMKRHSHDFEQFEYEYPSTPIEDNSNQGD